MKTFMLMSPAGAPMMGRRRDMPSLMIPETFGYECQNIVNNFGLIKHADGRVAQWPTQKADGQIQLLTQFQLNNQSLQLVVGTNDKFYYVAAGALHDISPAIAPIGTNADFYSFDTMESAGVNQFYATRNSDNLFQWDGVVSHLFAKTAGGPPKAKYVHQHQNYLFLLNIIDTGTGNQWSSTIEWCDLGLPTHWISGATNTMDAGQATLAGSDPITGAAEMGSGYMGIFKFNSLWQLYTTGAQVTGGSPHQLYQQVPNIGMTAPFSLVTAWDGCYFYGTDQHFWKWDGASFPVKISEDRIDDIVKNINPNGLGQIYGAVMEGLEMIAWIVPVGASLTPNMLLIFDYKRQAWSWMSFSGSVLCPGGYMLTASDSWSSAVGTWAQQIGRWEDVTYLQGAKQNLIGDPSGNIYELFGAVTDLGNTFDGIWQSQKLHFKSPMLYKRLTKMQHYFVNEYPVDRFVNISLCLDNQNTYQPAVNFNLNGGAGLDQLQPMVIDDYRNCVAKTFQLQVESTDNFQYLGTIFYYDEVGLR
jgi:hypothetical protein